MNLWIDVREACRPRMAGKGQWTYRSVEALLRRSDVRCTLLSDAPIPGEWKSLPGFAGARSIPAKGLRWHLAAARLLVRERSNVDVFLAPTSFIIPFLIGRRVPCIPVIHDLIAFRSEPHDRKARWIERFTLPRALRTCRAYCTVSAATMNAVQEKFLPNTNVVVVGAGPTVDERATWVGGGKHVLCVGTLCPRKNQLRLIKAYAALPPVLRDEVTLILVGGRGWHDDEIVAMAGSTPGVEWRGFQPGEAVTELLRTCRAFAYVSEEEGFGLPVLDALRVGAPVLASSIASITEVAGDVATYVDPLSIDAIADGLRKVVTEPSIMEKAVERSDEFSWQTVAEKIVTTCRSVVDNRA